MPWLYSIFIHFIRLSFLNASPAVSSYHLPKMRFTFVLSILLAGPLLAAAVRLPQWPPYPRGYSWRDCHRSRTSSHHFRFRRNIHERRADTAEPATADLWDYYPASPNEEIPAPPRPAPDPAVIANTTTEPASVAETRALERRKGTCSVSKLWEFHNLATSYHGTEDYIVAAGRNLAFSVISDVTVTGIQMYYKHGTQFILGPRVGRHSNSLVINWHAPFNTIVYWLIEFAHGGVTGATRLIDSAPA